MSECGSSPSVDSERLQLPGRLALGREVSQKLPGVQRRERRLLLTVFRTQQAVAGTGTQQTKSASEGEKDME